MEIVAWSVTTMNTLSSILLEGHRTGINIETVRKIFHEKLCERYVCSTLVSHSLNDKQKNLRKCGAMAIK